VDIRFFGTPPESFSAAAPAHEDRLGLELDAEAGEHVGAHRLAGGEHVGAAAPPWFTSTSAWRA
jgi:hypothetical protein